MPIGIAVLFWLLKLETEVRHDGLYVRYFPFHIHFKRLGADDLSIGEPTTRLMNELSVYFDARARFSEAEPLMRRALEIFEKSLGPDHPNTQTVRGNLESLK